MHEAAELAALPNGDHVAAEVFGHPDAFEVVWGDDAGAARLGRLRLDVRIARRLLAGSAS